jgi:aldose 1-epimerase
MFVGARTHPRLQPILLREHELGRGRNMNVRWCLPLIALLGGLAFILLPRHPKPAEPLTMIKPGVYRAPWGHTSGGEPVDIYSLRNQKGMEVRISTYGAIIVRLITPDRNGHLANVVLGLDSIEGYESRAYRRESPYFGAVIGRYANRIDKAQFPLNGHTISLSVNNKPNHLHGGIKGLDKVVWKEKATESADRPSVALTYESRDGEEGYPGNLSVSVSYFLTDDALEIEYRAISDQDTIINLTNHSYFNLKGAGEGDILGHVLKLNADRFTPVNAALIPTGERRPVAGTPFDFTQPTAIGARIDENNEQLLQAKGYDENFVLNDSDGRLKFAAQLREPQTGRNLEVWTTEPGLQLYTGNFLRGDLTTENGKPFVFRGGLCLETQHFPDSPNHPDFPSTILKRGETFFSHTVYRFNVD